MKKKDEPITEMQQLAEKGWMQMQEMLRQHALNAEAPVLAPSSKKRNFLPLIAACLFFSLIFTCFFIFNNQHHIEDVNAGSKTSNHSKTVVNDSTTTAKPPVTTIPQVATSEIISQEKNNLPGKLNTAFIQSPKVQFTEGKQTQADVVKQPESAASKKISTEKLSTEKLSTETITSKPGLKEDTATNILNPDSLPKTRKPKIPVSKKIRLFAGAGLNVPAWNKNPNSFPLTNLNIHPGFTIVVPLTEKLSLHSGLWAFSTVHGREVSAKEQQLVNNLGSNLYYNITTTSIIKASYFDIPLTLHYSINKNWSVGSGLQLSKLYKVNIREQKESYDYNNMRMMATTEQYSSTPSQAAAALQKKLEIKKYEPRFVVEANFEEDQMADFRRILLWPGQNHYA